uniref:Ferrous iron transport protein A n=1 Tax=Ammonifex degensii TaxID=42838 RepID=A0A7C1FDY1_9THEO
METVVERLSALPVGAGGRIARVEAAESLRQRLLAMGVAPGREVAVEGVAPLGDPIAVKVKGYSLTLRKSEAEKIFVEVKRE